MKNIKIFMKNNLKNVIALILGVLTTTTVYAAKIVLQSINVEYDYTESNLKDSNGHNVDNVQTAIDELYKKAGTNSGTSSGCAKDYYKIKQGTYDYQCYKEH